jgi:hypothetical protein
VEQEGDEDETLLVEYESYDAKTLLESEPDLAKVDPHSQVLQWEALQLCALGEIEAICGLPMETLYIEHSLSSCAYIFAFLSNYTLDAIDSPEKIYRMLNFLGLPKEEQELCWWLGKTGAWKKVC